MAPARETTVGDGAGRDRPPAVEARNLNKRFGATIALKDVDIRAGAQTIHAFVGENGAGKSTFLGIVAGRLAPTSGDVTVFGEPYQFGDPRYAHNLGIAAIYQELTIVPAMSALANVFLGQALSRGGLLAHDVASAGALGFLLKGPIGNLSQAAMVFSLMNQDIHTTVPGVKNLEEAQEIARCADLPPIPEGDIARLKALYARGFRD